ncbi:Uncharacterised protein [Mycobacteroides abscessus subsp. abscessus]|nr:Uncharacterised protein [Mycobacteroides abscessus subsp. abscessus]
MLILLILVVLFLVLRRELRRLLLFLIRFVLLQLFGQIINPLPILAGLLLLILQPTRQIINLLLIGLVGLFGVLLRRLLPGVVLRRLVLGGLLLSTLVTALRAFCPLDP